MSYYLVVKSLHIIAVISWMAGLLYLPRLFVYHANAVPGGEASEMLKIMERKLLRLIMNPAMIATYLFGIMLAVELNTWNAGWLHAKLALVILLTGAHHVMVRHFKAFRDDRNTKSQRYFRLLNEAPTVLMIVIVILVVIKPF